MPRRLLTPSLRRSLIVSVLAVVLGGTLAMVLAFSATLRIRNAIDRDTSLQVEDQRIADQIVALTYQQQIEAYRDQQDPDPSHREAFQRLGDEADAQMRTYLFRDLSPAARLQAEIMKEAHASFEVAALHGIELAEQGDAKGAAARLGTLSERTAALDSSVTGFLRARGEQREELVRNYRQAATWARFALLLIGLGVLLLGLWLGRRLRGLVVVPLEQLAIAAQRIRSGDLAARVPPQRYAELQSVGVEFNAMADAVQTTRETIEMQNEELRQSLEQLHDTQDELVQQEKLSAMGQMLAGLAHELNNPLGGVLGLAQLLRADLAASGSDEMRRLDAEIAMPIEREAMRARDLVRSLLTFSRKSGGETVPVSLAIAVNTAVSLLTRSFTNAGKRLETNIPPELVVEADVQKLEHAVINVMNNALHAIVASEGTVLTIAARADVDDMVALTFTDDGPGFANVRAAFDPFYTTKPAGQGTGLGLMLVKQYVEEAGGTVTASNLPGRGARVTITLRRGTTSTDQLVAPASATAVRATPASVATLPGGVRPRVLVVDDEPSLREVQRRLLMLEGIDVLLAENGEQAREILAREHVDLVVSDLRMPGGTDGHQLLSSLWRDRPHLAARAIIVTGDVMSAMSGDTPVPEEQIIRKPFTRAEYVERIRRALADIKAE